MNFDVSKDIPKANKSGVGNTANVPDFPSELLTPENPFQIFEALEILPTHPAEPDLFARHYGIPAHRQTIIAQTRMVLVGGGGLNSAAGFAFVRSGTRFVTVIDDDLVDRTNLARQLFFKEDLGEPKGISLARNLSLHAVGGGSITGIALPFEEAIEQYSLPADIFIVGVDNNACRLRAVQEARKRRVPAIFAMLSADGMRCQVFLQGASPLAPCLWCALPNLDPEKSMPCVSAIISACFMASSHTVFLAHRAMAGWGKLEPFNWRECDLSGMTPDRTGTVQKRKDCPICKEL